MSAAGAVLAGLAAAVDGQDWDALRALLAVDFRCRLVHTGEVLDREGYVRLNSEYPGSWRFDLQDAVAVDDRACGRAVVTDGAETFHVALFLTVRDGLVRESVEVWAEQAPVPQERRPG